MIEADRGETAGGEQAERRAWRVVLGWPLLVFPAAKLLVHLLTLRGYGVFRDELYYLACSERLAFGYVDHPPLSILVLRLVRELGGDSLIVLRLVPALAGAATVLVVGLLARDLGGGWFAQSLAMLGAVLSPTYLALGHYYSMNAFSLLIWSLAGLLLVRIVDGGAGRLWLWLGGLLGLGLENKIDVLWLGAGLAVALLLTPQRAALRTRWPWLGGAIAAALFAPHVLWQIATGWPTLEFIQNATQQKMVRVSALSFLWSQLESMNLAVAPIWLAGLLWLCFAGAGRRYRLLGWIYLAVLGILVAAGSSRSSYLAPAYSWLLAVGGVAGERLSDRLSLPRLRWSALPLVAALGAVAVPFGLPILPVQRFVAYAAALGVSPATSERKELAELPQFYADMHGWESIARSVALAARRLSPEERPSAFVFAPDYGVAGAVEHFGPALGLPPVLSGHNNYWLWGPGEVEPRTLLVVGGSRARLDELFASVELAASTDCGFCMPYENHQPVWVARRPRRNLRELWPELKHFD